MSIIGIFSEFSLPYCMKDIYKIKKRGCPFFSDNLFLIIQDRFFHIIEHWKLNNVI